ncbi:MAG TPA: hypothetical protein PLG73_04500 [Candidatus Sumerlaeota bacterium]|nr:hypothetical protein [Candidatus Sumerlaeota bacterium]
MADSSGPSVRPRRIPFALRAGIVLLAILLTFLFIWLLGFVLDDIGDLNPPDYNALMDAAAPAELTERQAALGKELQRIGREIARRRERQATLQEGMDNARSLMDQMIKLHQLYLERGEGAPPDQEALLLSQERFLEAQNQFEQINNEIAGLNEAQHAAQDEQNAIAERIEEILQPAREQYEAELTRHRLLVGSLKLAFIVPVLLAAAWLTVRRRASIYRPIYIALCVAAFWKVAGVMWDYFPREFFKYIAIAAALVVTIGLLVRLLRAVARPRPLDLLKRYREGYKSQHCPVCDYPIGRGPLRFAVWTRGGPRALAAGGETPPLEDTPYTCPACGTPLYERCGACGWLRHSLLPHCESCGARNDGAESVNGTQRVEGTEAT